MAKEKAPAFQFYPRDWLSDINVRAMTHEERGMYWDLCAHEWLEGRLPDNPEEIARILDVTPEELAPHWDRIRSCFETTRAGYLVHPRLKRERKKQRERKKKQSDSGLKGANRRWRKPKEDKGIDGVPNGVAINTPMGSDSSSSSSASSTAVTTPPVVPPKGGKNAPPVPTQEIVDAWNKTCGDVLPRVRHLTEPRRKKIITRCRDLRSVVGDLALDPEWWASEIFSKVRESPFCRGENGRGWKASLDWLMDRRDAAIKALEGQYDDTNTVSDAIAERYRALG